MVSDEGVASCNDPKTGEVHWAERLGVKGECASSPIHANGKIYSFSINGDCVVFEPNPEGLKILARNKLDDGCMASPAVVGDSLLVRTKQNLYRFDRTQSTAEKTVQPVFNGKDLTGWKVPKGNDKAKWYQVIDGVLQIRSGPKKKGSVLWTEKNSVTSRWNSIFASGKERSTRAFTFAPRTRFKSEFPARSRGT